MSPKSLLLIFLSVYLISQVTLSVAQFVQVSYFPLDNSSPAYINRVVRIQDNRVAFEYKGLLYSADETANGTLYLGDSTDQQPIFAGPQAGTVYYSTAPATVKFWNSTTNSSTVLAAGYQNPLGTFGYSCLFVDRFSVWIFRAEYRFSYGVLQYIPGVGFVNPVSGVQGRGYSDFASEVTIVEDVVVWALPAPKVARIQDLFYAKSMNTIFFKYSYPAPGAKGLELWRYVTFMNSSSIVGDIYPGKNDSNPRSLCEVPGVGLFFFANPTSSQKSVSLYWTGAPNTLKRIKYFIVDSASTDIPMVSVGARAVFIITDSSKARQLWSTDGTVEGTFRLRGTSDYQLASNGDFAFFVAYVSGYGHELWQTDGTLNGTFRVPYETIPGRKNSNITKLSVVDDDLYFNAATPDGNIQLFRYTPVRNTPAPLILFDPVDGWKTGGYQVYWGTGSCEVTSGSAPANQPLKDRDMPTQLTDQSIIEVTGYQGCGHFYTPSINLQGVKEIRFWISSTTEALIEVQVKQPCEPFRGDVPGRDLCKTELKIHSTRGEWMSFGIPLNDRKFSEFANTDSPFLVTASANGTVSIANIVAVY